VSDRARARLRMIELLAALPERVDVEVDVKGLTRSDYDAIEATGAEIAITSLGRWTKTVDCGTGSKIDLWTTQPAENEILRELRARRPVLAEVTSRRLRLLRQEAPNG
jgi:hypothetical protein